MEDQKHAVIQHTVHLQLLLEPDRYCQRPILTLTLSISIYKICIISHTHTHTHTHTQFNKYIKGTNNGTWTLAAAAAAAAL